MLWSIKREKKDSLETRILKNYLSLNIIFTDYRMFKQAIRTMILLGYVGSIVKDI